MNVVRLIVMVVLQAVLLEAVSPFGEWTQPQWALWALFMLPPQSERFTKLGFGFLLGLGLDLMMGTGAPHGGRYRTRWGSAWIAPAPLPP